MHRQLITDGEIAPFPAVDAALQAYRGLIRRGIGEAWALESARRVFAYHEPDVGSAAAAAIVRELVRRYPA